MRQLNGPAVFPMKPLIIRPHGTAVVADLSSESRSSLLQVLPEPVHKWKDVDGYNTLVSCMQILYKRSQQRLFKTTI